MKKAFYSLALVLAFFLALSVSSAYFLRASASHARASQQALAFIAVKEARLDYLHAVRQVLANTAGESAQERLHNTALNLAQLEQLIEREHASRGVSLDAWAGVVSAAERDSLAAAMLELRSALKCEFCIDLSAAEAAGFVFPTNASASLVSRKGSAFSNTTSLSEAIGRAGFGCSVYAHGIASTCFFGEENAVN